MSRVCYVSFAVSSFREVFILGAFQVMISNLPNGLTAVHNVAGFEISLQSTRRKSPVPLFLTFDRDCCITVHAASQILTGASEQYMSEM
jgi:hypothetical protein